MSDNFNLRKFLLENRENVSTQSLNESDTEDKLTALIIQAIEEVGDNVIYTELASAVANVILQEYGTHNISPFLEDLQNKLNTNK